MVAGCKAIPGVVSVKADIANTLLTLRFDPAVTSREKVVAAVDDLVSRLSH